MRVKESFAQKYVEHVEQIDEQVEAQISDGLIQYEHIGWIGSQIDHNLVVTY